MDIDKIIKDSFQQLLTEFEVRKSSFLNIVHHNIDILVRNANSWFGDDVPQEYTDVLNSLINLTIIYFDQNRDFIKFSDQENEVFHIDSIFKEIREDMLFLLRKDITFTCKDDILINTSRVLFKESCLNIFLCMAQFAGEDTCFEVSVETHMSSVRIQMKFDNLTADTPELSKLMKVFYSYYSGQNYHFRIGLELPFMNIKKSGGIVNAAQRGGSSITVNISYPSSDFLKTVDDIRKKTGDEKASLYSGDVYVSVRDGVLEMVLRENLADTGYSIRVLSPEKIRFFPNGGKALVTDKQSYREIIETLADDDMPASKIIVICNSDDDIVMPDNVKRLPMPFEVSDLADIIEGRR